ncbi:DUF3108 domain-containing protein [Mucilaginibacter glaciei]|uniref:Outer membrane lipoprotein-sorting protein n=1 Tax=Mucilaginibacter glaciei TaxID=2772109 RepID=A0A926NN24_9SPHI|nr:hypothetical protein [Mucilaginibacter glaciei]MBD1394191.1 hypothetical protein [Mucilaginibacter glaciei]
MKVPCSASWLIHTALATLLILSGTNIASAQVDTIRLKDHRLNTSALKPGLRQYLVYFQIPKSPKILRYWLWLRNTQIENRKGQRVFVTSQHWYGSDTMSYRTAYSVNKVNDFAPLYHSETVAGKNRSFNWGADKIVSADTAAINTLKGFSLDFTSPNFNWNLDIETFEMLPLAAGKIFAINFYDAGSGKPDYIIYKVIGSEVITTYDNHQVDCWKLFNESDYRGQHATETFWISKKGHEFLKEEDAFPGGFRYKVKMPAASNSLLPRFLK